MQFDHRRQQLEYTGHDRFVLRCRIVEALLLESLLGASIRRPVQSFEDTAEADRLGAVAALVVGGTFRVAAIDDVVGVVGLGAADPVGGGAQRRSATLVEERGQLVEAENTRTDRAV